MSVTGTGGVGSLGNNIGLNLSAGTISAGGSGTVQVIGVGGASAGNNNLGIYLESFHSSITSNSGNVTVTGTGGGLANGTGTDNNGIVITESNARISSSSGNVSVTGNGGIGSGVAGAQRDQGSEAADRKLYLSWPDRRGQDGVGKGAGRLSVRR